MHAHNTGRASGNDDEALAAYLRETGRAPLLSREQEAALAQRIHVGDKDAAEQLVLSNLRLVVSVSKHYLGRGLPLADLIQEGNIGLMRATRGYDASHGTKFSTYATWWIRQALSRAVAQTGRAIRLPVYVTTQLGRLARAREDLREELGRDPTEKELCAALGTARGPMSLMRLHELEETARQNTLVSLDQARDNGDSGDDARTIGEDIADERERVLPEASALRGADREYIARLLREALSDRRDRLVIELRYGLGNEDGEPETLAEIASRLCISRERVRQIEGKAMTLLRKHLGARVAHTAGRDETATGADEERSA